MSPSRFSFLLESIRDNTVWYRGMEKDPGWPVASVAYREFYSGAEPQELPAGVPDEIRDAYEAGQVRKVTGLYPDCDFRYSKQYSGMSNYGFGVYFSNSLSWARRYGSYVVAARVNPDHIMSIRWEDRRTPGTPCHDLVSYVCARSDDTDYRQQMPHFRAYVLRRKKRALFVDTGGGEGQLVVYQPEYINAVCMAEFKK